MILAEPPPSQGDVHFRIAGIPVRIHPFFWLVALILGLQGWGLDKETPPMLVIAWVVALFGSILVHEMGHALLQRHYGGHPRITLYGMGGLASCGDCDRSTRAQIIISLAGPCAGFLLAVVLIALVAVLGHQPGSTLFRAPETDVTGLGLFGTAVYWRPFASETINDFVRSMLWINVMWGAVNLLPIYPLDGGQISREICQMGHPRHGIILSLRISMVAAAGMALVGLSWGSLLVILFFGYLSYSSYRALEAYRASL